MFGLFKKKCPQCGMELEKDRDYLEGYGKKFCSESCKEEYRKKTAETKPKSSGGCCH